ncbi:MAG: hypothetical protein ABSG67_21120 [Thermoguttaceae bacterium]|jgi:hypothetical protein
MNESPDYNPSTAFLGNSAKNSYAGYACANGFAWQLRSGKRQRAADGNSSTSCEMADT